MIDSFLKKYIKASKIGIRITNMLIRKYLSLSLLRFVFRRYLHSLITKEREEVLTAEMAKIKVELKCFDEYNHLAEKCERMWTALDGKQLQIVLEKLDVMRVIEAVGHMNKGEVS